MGANELSSIDVDFDAENFEIAYAKQFEAKVPAATLTGRVVVLKAWTPRLAPPPKTTASPLRVAIRQMDRAKETLGQTEQELEVAEAQLEQQREPLEQELDGLAPRLRKSQAGKRLLAKVGKRSTWQRATRLRAALAEDALGVPAEELQHLENAYEMMAAAHEVLTQAQQRHRLAVADYLGKVVQLRREILVVWTAYQARWMPRAA